jgi:Nickel responsive protein SCO4226-like
VHEFVAELYVAGFDTAAVERGAASARVGAEQARREGVDVRYIRTIFVPEDETCFYLYEAPSVEDVEAAARHAGLTFERIKAAA